MFVPSVWVGAAPTTWMWMDGRMDGSDRQPFRSFLNIDAFLTEPYPMAGSMRTFLSIDMREGGFLCVSSIWYLHGGLVFGYCRRHQQIFFRTLTPYKQGEVNGFIGVIRFAGSATFFVHMLITVIFEYCANRFHSTPKLIIFDHELLCSR